MQNKTNNTRPLAYRSNIVKSLWVASMVELKVALQFAHVSLLLILKLGHMAVMASVCIYSLVFMCYDFWL